MNILTIYLITLVINVIIFILLLRNDVNNGYDILLKEIIGLAIFCLFGPVGTVSLIIFITITIIQFYSNIVIFKGKRK